MRRFRGLFPGFGPPPSIGRGAVCRWHRRDGRTELDAITAFNPIELSDLRCIDRQKQIIERNTRQFLQGLPANNVLLWGPRGTGKSSLVRAVFSAYRALGLTLVEVSPEHLVELPDIAARLGPLPWRLVIFCDDLSFERDDRSFRALKAALDGSTSGVPDNLLIYATSNRRHLVPESMHENLESRVVEGELHLSESIEEKLSLSERFGIRLAFHPFGQEEYLAIVEHWLDRLGPPDVDPAAARDAALQWALECGSRSGRSAWQFARDWIGRQQLEP